MTSRRILAEIRDLRSDSGRQAARASELTERSNELMEEIRAQTQAIFKLIDRLDGGAATA